jgi:hypothetical protein
MTKLSDLPNDIIVEIINNLKFDDKSALGSICRYFRNAYIGTICELTLDVLQLQSASIYPTKVQVYKLIINIINMPIII